MIAPDSLREPCCSGALECSRKVLCEFGENAGACRGLDVDHEVQRGFLQADGGAAAAVDLAHPSFEAIAVVSFPKFACNGDAESRVTEIVRRNEEYCVSGNVLAALIVDSNKICASGDSLLFREALSRGTRH